MTGFLILVVLVLLVWLIRTSSKAGETESLLAELTRRIYLVEEELKKVRALLSTERREARSEPAPAEAAPRTQPVEPLRERVAEPPTEPAVPVLRESIPAPPPPPPSVFEPQPVAPSRRLLNLEETLGT